MAEGKETVVVTGSGGFIGSAVVEQLAKRFTVIGMDRRSRLPPSKPSLST